MSYLNVGIAALLVLLSLTVVTRAADETTAKPGPLVHKMKDIDGKDVDLSQYKGKVVLIVNVASNCGYTKQYTGLEKLYQSYKEKGFVILAFPANNFGGQEPGTDAQIKEFCTGTSSKYHVTFPIFSKISVKGADEDALYKELQQFGDANAKAGDVSWNFEKFLVGKDGQIIGRYKSAITPEDKKLTGAIEKELAK